MLAEMYSARHAAAVRVVHSVASAAEPCALHAEPPASSLLPVNCCTALQGHIILYNPKHRPRWTNGPPIGVPKLAGGWRSSAYHYTYRQAAGMHDVSRLGWQGSDPSGGRDVPPPKRVRTGPNQSHPSQEIAPFLAICRLLACRRL